MCNGSEAGDGVRRDERGLGLARTVGRSVEASTTPSAVAFIEVDAVVIVRDLLFIKLEVEGGGGDMRVGDKRNEKSVGASWPALFS